MHINLFIPLDSTVKNGPKEKEICLVKRMKTWEQKAGIFWDSEFLLQDHSTEKKRWQLLIWKHTHLRLFLWNFPASIFPWSSKVLCLDGGTRSEQKNDIMLMVITNLPNWAGAFSLAPCANWTSGYFWWKSFLIPPLQVSYFSNDFARRKYTL